MGSIIMEEEAESSRFLNLNISGRKFVLMKTSIRKRSFLRIDSEKSILEQLVDDPRNRYLADDYCEKSDTYFFDRSISCIDSILDFYRFGEVHRPVDVCPEKFLTELNFWKIDRRHICICCAETSPKSRQIDGESDSTPPNNCDSLENQSNDGSNDDNFPEFEGVKGGNLRRKFWILLEVPQSSIWAKIYCFFSISIIFLSVLLLILGSIPKFQNSKGEPLPVLWIIEDACVAWFSLEFVVRILVTPVRCKFMKEATNIVDILSIIPFYLELIFFVAGFWTENLQVGLPSLRRRHRQYF